MSRLSRYLRRLLSVALPALLCLIAVRPSPAASDEKERWQEYRSEHFTVITDAGEKKGREICLRFEQMRAVFGQLLMRKHVGMPLPLTIYALRGDKQFFQMAPLRNGKPIEAPGFLVSGDDRAFIVLYTFEDDPWRAVAHQFAHYLLDYNYPPAQAWFDEGFVEYFSSIRVDNKQVELGSDPELGVAYTEDILGNETQVRNRPHSLTELLNVPVWMAVPDLFTAKHDASASPEGSHHTLFYAQSWITVHYLLNKEKLPDTGTYFDLVQNQKMPVEKAILQAYDMSVPQFEQAVKDYYHSLAQLQSDFDASQKPEARNNRVQISQFPAPLGPDDVAITMKPVSEADARAQLAEVMVRLPERRRQGLDELHAVLSLTDKNGETAENEIAHRALAWVALDGKQYAQAVQELGTAAGLNPRDTWLRYYLSLVKYKQAQEGHQEIQGLANMMQDLKATVDWYPEFAEAYNMLAMARIEGGGANSAMDAMRAALALSPRNQQYLFNLGQIYVAAKKWDAAQELFSRLRSSSNPKIAAAAQAQLQELATVKKYGISPNAPKRAYQTSPFDELAQEAEKRAQAQEAAAPDTRPTRYMKGRLVSVDCSQPPTAIVNVATGAKTLKLRAADFKSLLVIGADSFSCDWRNRAVAINYKAGGAVDGDLVSVEVKGD